MALKDILGKVAVAATGPVGLAISQRIKGQKQQLAGAKYYENLIKEIPQVKESEYLKPLIGTAQSALYDNPLARATQRERQTSTANMLYAARSGDPQMLAALASSAFGQGQQADLQSRIAEEQLKEQRRQSYYGTLQAGMQSEQNQFANLLTALQSKASLGGAAYQTRAQAYNQAASDIFKGIGTAAQLFTGFPTGNIFGSGGKKATNIVGGVDESGGSIFR